jgi:hypothetical protein
LTVNQYIQNFSRLSEVKKKIIRCLWGRESDEFPKPWIGSSELLELTGQKYFDRRIRELRDESGCDIETKHTGGEHSYRFRSNKRQAENPRAYLTESEKRTLFQQSSYTCQICGEQFPAGIRGLQADHKVPLIREGSHAPENWQPICNECNIGKRRACAGCEDNCSMCPWAFPEQVGITTLLHLPPEILTALRQHAGNSQKKIQAEIIHLLKQGLGLD